MPIAIPHKVQRRIAAQLGNKMQSALAHYVKSGIIAKMTIHYQ